MVGRYSLALALTAPVFMFSNLNLATVLASDVNEKRGFGDYLGLRLLCSSLCVIPIAGFTYLGHYGATMTLVVAVVTISKYVESISDISYGLMQNHERFDYMAKSLILKGVLTIVAVTLVLFFSGDLTISLLALATVWVFVLLFFDLPHIGRWVSLRPTLSPQALVPILVFSLPLGVVGALGSLGVQIPRFAMEHWRGERELGIFSAIVALGMVARMITLALSRTALPRLSRQYAQGSVEAFQNLTVKLAVLGVVVGLMGFMVAAVFGRTLLTLLYTPEYARYNGVFMVVMIYVGLVTTFSFLGTAATAAQSFSPQVAIHLVKIATIAGVCFWAVPRFGALGAAWALVVGTLVSSVGYLLLIRRLTESRAGSIGAVTDSLLGSE